MSAAAAEAWAPGGQSAVERVAAAVAAMPWLGESDQAMVDLAKRYAQAIDDAEGLALEAAQLPHLSPDDPLANRVRRLETACDAVRTLASIGPQLAAALRTLGGGPGERKALAGKGPARGGLAAVRDDDA